MIRHAQTRRHLLKNLALPALAGGMLAACAGEDAEVGAVEDLMREHGILRRIVLAFRESAATMRQGKAVAAFPLADAASLFRSFGEEYHEKMLEEAHIFPRLRQETSRAAAMVDTLIAQHDRGRQITDYILATTRRGIGTGDVAPLSAAFDSFERMYAHHTAREDTIIFPAWKRMLSDRELSEMGETFEDIEKRQFGTDGFDMAARKMDGIEQALGLASLADFTAPPPAA
jgi:hemerythrin-like domain-containing protein